MNRKAAALGMSDTHYVEPTGLSSRNQSTAQDLALLVKAASEVPLIAELSTSREAEVAVGQRQLQFRNTNALVRDASWEIGLQKTGYISEAGRCLVMQANLAGRKLIMVLLDSAGKYSRIGDAERLRSWLERPRADRDGLSAAVAQRGGDLRRRRLDPLDPGFVEPVGRRRHRQPRHQMALVVEDAGGHAAHAQFQFLVVAGHAAWRARWPARAPGAPGR